MIQLKTKTLNKAELGIPSFIAKFLPFGIFDGFSKICKIAPKLCSNQKMLRLKKSHASWISLCHIVTYAWSMIIHDLYSNCHNWIKFCSLCTKKGLSCTEGTGILDKIVVYGCMFKPDNITIHDINTGEIIDYTEDFEFDEDTLRLDVNQLFGVDFCSRAFRITWSKNIFYT